MSEYGKRIAGGRDWMTKEGARWSDGRSEASRERSKDTFTRGERGKGEEALALLAKKRKATKKKISVHSQREILFLFIVGLA